ncbi:MAG: DUF2812 domain-containing protein [Solobacterium sp.]|nr:DUF2812 domain-containing protein [Solobacterium sp.]
MMKTFYRLFWVWDFDKEEQWLNEMAEQGWVLDSYQICRYTFVNCEPGEYIIRMEMHGGFDPGYIEFMEDTGAELIAKFFGWMYFRRKAEFGEFNIFSDIDSKISHLKGIANLLMIIGFMNIIIGIANSILPVHMGFINLLCAALLMYAVGRIHGKIEALRQERRLHE